MFFRVDTANASHATECWSLVSLAGNNSASVAAWRSTGAGAKTASVASGSWIVADTKFTSFSAGGWIVSDAKPASFSTETSSVCDPLGAAMYVVIAMRHISVCVPVLRNAICHVVIPDKYYGR